MIKYMWITLALLVVIIGCSREESTHNLSSLNDSITRPDSEVRGAKIYLYDKGEITAEVISDKIVKFESNDSTMAYKLDINIIDTLGHVSTTVTGDSGIIRENQRVMNIYGNVVVVTEDKTRLETEYLWWDANTDRIKTDAFVRITKGSDVITGWGLDADNKLTRIKILNQVSGTLTDPKKLNEDTTKPTPF